MIRMAALLGLAATLAACSPERQEAPATSPSAAPTATATRRAVPQPSTARDPAKVLQAWAKAMSVKDWEAGYLYWENRGAGTGMSLDQFKAHWAQLNNPEFEIGPAAVEGAAGSLYYAAPVTLIDGTQRIAGEVVLRRVNDVPGASAEDLRWHIVSTTLEF